MPNKRNKNLSAPPVIAMNPYMSLALRKEVSERIRYYGYKVIDLKLTRNAIPPGTNIVGLVTQHFPYESLVKDFLKRGWKIVRCGPISFIDENGIIPEVVIDYAAVGKLAAEHFAERQYKDVAFVGNDPWANKPILYNAFHKRALELGCKCHLLQVKKSPNISKKDIEKKNEDRMLQIQEWLEQIPKPVGIFTYHDKHAALIYLTATLAGIQVPERVSILGLGNEIETCESLPVTLSSIDVNDAEMGRCAVDVLIKLINGETVPDSLTYIQPKGVVTRQSTNILAIPDAIMAQAMHFIWDHFAEQLSVDDIAKASGVSRRTLSRKFRQHLGHGINQELCRKRLEKSCELLRKTRMTIADVAAATGFPNTSYFYIAFRKDFGMTPAKFRNNSLI